ncbi:MAG: PCRF domain-containing protein, partial [Bacteroidia bacterium]
MDPQFWNEPKKAEAHLRKIKEKKVWTDAYDGLESQLGDLDVLVEFKEAGEATDAEVDEQFKALLEATEDLEFKNMLQGEEDALSCVIE